MAYLPQRMNLAEIDRRTRFAVVRTPPLLRLPIFCAVQRLAQIMHSDAHVRQIGVELNSRAVHQNVDGREPLCGYGHRRLDRVLPNPTSQPIMAKPARTTLRSSPITSAPDAASASAAARPIPLSASVTIAHLPRRLVTNALLRKSGRSQAQTSLIVMRRVANPF
jgi:hypothetical protein